MDDEERHRRDAFWDSREGRQLFAYDRRSRSEELVYMEQGAADDLRGAARAGHLVCPVLDCPEPAFTTVGGRRRHHFRHLPGAGVVHDGETLAHQTAKHLIGRWARSKYPKARVEVDTERVDNGQLPDVLVELPDGERYAIEIQYSPLTVAAWQQRHDGYTELGIHDVWILGHLPPHLRRNRRIDSEQEPAIGDLHQAIHRAGLPLLWINPFVELIGVGLLSSYDSERLTNCDATDFWGRVRLEVDPLDVCRLERGRLLTPGLASHLERLAEAQRQREAQRRLEAENERRAAAADAQHAAREQARLAEWERYSETVRHRLGGSIPEFLTEPLPAERLVWANHPSYWRTRIYLSVVEGSVGCTFDFGEASRDLAAAQTHARRMPFPFVTQFLNRLHLLGYIEVPVGPARFISGDITVLADSTKPPEARERTASSARSRNPVSRSRDAPVVSRPPKRGPVVPAQPAPPRPRAVDPRALPPLLRDLTGVPGRKRWEQIKVSYIRRPELRRVPELLLDEGPRCRAFGVHPPLWHHFVVEQCIDGRTGRHVDDCEASVALGFTRRPDEPLLAAIGWYLDHLRISGLLEMDRDGYRVVAGLDAAAFTRQRSG